MTNPDLMIRVRGFWRPRWTATTSSMALSIYIASWGQALEAFDIRARRKAACGATTRRTHRPKPPNSGPRTLPWLPCVCSPAMCRLHLPGRISNNDPSADKRCVCIQVVVKVERGRVWGGEKRTNLGQELSLVPEGPMPPRTKLGVEAMLTDKLAICTHGSATQNLPPTSEAAVAKPD